jgi:hypothetical protein
VIVMVALKRVTGVIINAVGDNAEAINLIGLASSKRR